MIESILFVSVSQNSLSDAHVEKGKILNHENHCRISDEGKFPVKLFGENDITHPGMLYAKVNGRRDSRRQTHPTQRIPLLVVICLYIIYICIPNKINDNNIDIATFYFIHD